MKAGHSHFWMDLMAVKDQVLDLVSFNLRDGCQIRF